MAQTLIEMAKELTQALIETKILAPEDMHQHLHQVHATLLTLKAREDRHHEDGAGMEVHVSSTSAPKDWKKSIKKHSVECLICGDICKQLSARHLSQHGLDPRTYREQFGIPSAQALSSKETTAMRRRIVQDTRPWEKAPSYRKAHESTPPPASQPKQARKKVSRPNP